MAVDDATRWVGNATVQVPSRVGLTRKRQPDILARPFLGLRITTEGIHMYAVVVTGGKQYRVMQGETLRVELLDAEPGAAVVFDQVLLVGDGDSILVGQPLLSGASVSAKVKSHGRADKIKIVKFRRRKHHRKQMGHRQHFTEVEITGIAKG